MNHSEIKERIQRNMADANLKIDELRVQPDPYRGWRIAVISPGFERKYPYERKDIAFQGLEEVIIEWSNLLTPGERESMGYLPIDSTLEDIPLWPESLARQPNLEEIKFPSHLDGKLARPIFAAFYSYKGGIGSSTALAYTAQILASRGRKVLCVDMDWESPTLPALFGKESEVNPELGVVDLLLALDQEETPDVFKNVLRLSATEELYCLPAGSLTANYARKLWLMAPEGWYREERNPLRELMKMLGDLPFEADVVLLDASSGVCPISSPVLFDLADVAIASFYPNPQFERGTANLVRGLLASKTRRRELSLTPEVRFLVSPIPNTTEEVEERIKQKAMEWIREWITLDGKKMFDESEIAHFVGYKEAIATSDKILMDSDIWQDFDPVANWLESFL
ncbi:MAG: ParA family protein [Cyanobacteriota bacterium]|nr:ParA family protein [Cyanobacteriota bacterium]